jgi:hypothetical protein
MELLAQAVIGADYQDSTHVHEHYQQSRANDTVSDGDVLRAIMLAVPEYEASGDLSNWTAGIRRLTHLFDLNDNNTAIPETPRLLSSVGGSTQKGWVFTTAAELDRFIESKQELSPYILAIRTTNNQCDPEYVERKFLEWVQNGSELPYQNWHRPEDKSPVTINMGMDDFLDRYANRAEQIGIGMNGLDFRNFLSIAGNSLEVEVPEPAFIRKLGYDFLTTLRKYVLLQVQMKQGVSGQKESETRISDLESCLRFTLYGERGAFSDWHIDVLGGTWVTPITGGKYWFIYVGPWNQQVQDAIGSGSFQPAAKHVQMIHLRPGDSLLMRPGLSCPVPHCVLTLSDSLAAGGMVWSAADMDMTLRNMDFVIREPNATNEDIPRQLPEYLDATLDVMRRRSLRNLSRATSRLADAYVPPADQLERMEALIRSWREDGLLSCLCDGRCVRPTKYGKKEVCPCWKHDVSVHNGCTAWCECKCMGNT